jgi:transposase
MFALSAHQGFHLYRHATDMRKGFNGLSGLVRNKLGKDPLDGSAYIFLNRRGNRIKILVWEAGGFTLYYKLLEKGTFQRPSLSQDQQSSSISWQQLMLIVQGIELKSVKHRKRYTPLSQPVI